MAQKLMELNVEKLSCSFCLDLLKDPVAIPCGHSYCMSCIKECWDKKEREEERASCPQCRQTFPQRPVLVKNTMLAELVEEVKKVEARAASPHLYAGAEDVVCDFCSGKKLKALKSCLVCMSSFCHQHLQPHYTVAGLKKHKLVEATSKLQENVCSLHQEVMKIYCRTDHKCICHLCCLDDHKGHDMVSAAAERAERQTELEPRRQKIQQRVQDREREVKLLQQRVEAFNLSADEAVRHSEESLTQLIRLMEQRRSEVTQQIRSQQKSQVEEATELEEKLQQEITDLRRKDAELEKLSHSEDHLHFLNNYPSLSRLSPSDCPSIHVCPLSSFKDVTAAVSELKEKVEAALKEESVRISSALTKVELLPPAEPTTRAQFLRYATKITLDTNTVNKHLLLSDGNRKVTRMKQEQVYADHPDRFDYWPQVLSKEGLTGRCYWEVKWSGYNVDVAVAYKDISRKGNSYECLFGSNNKSWSLRCYSNGHKFRHDDAETPLSGPGSSKIGVYLDHEAGSLSFYRVSDTITLLHRVQTKFTQPLHAGVWLIDQNSCAEFVALS